MPCSRGGTNADATRGSCCIDSTQFFADSDPDEGKSRGTSALDWVGPVPLSKETAASAAYIAYDTPRSPDCNPAYLAGFN